MLGPGAGLPDGWPADLPAYDAGQLMTATVSADGRAINATWTDEIPVNDAFDAMSSTLTARGFVPVGEAGGADMLIMDEGMASNDFTSDAIDVNLTVVANGAQSTIMLNASVR